MVEALRSEVTVEGRTRVSTFPMRDQFGPELLYFSNCILTDEDPEPNGLEGLADVRVIAAILESARTDKSIALAPTEKSRPSLEQDIRRPPEKLKLVRA